MSPTAKAGIITVLFIIITRTSDILFPTSSTTIFPILLFFIIETNLKVDAYGEVFKEYLELKGEQA